LATGLNFNDFNNTWISYGQVERLGMWMTAVLGLNSGVDKEGLIGLRPRFQR